MDFLKLFRTRSIPREYFLQGRRFINLSSMAAFRNSSSFNNCIESNQVNLNRSVLCQKLRTNSNRYLALNSARYFSDVSSKDEVGDKSTTTQHSKNTEKVEDKSSEQDRASDSDSDEEERGSSKAAKDESSGSMAAPSQSQTGEPLPSEVDQSAWDNKIDKLYKEIQLEVLAYEPSVLDSYQWFVLTAATHLGIKIGKYWSPQKSNKMRFQLLKSAFVHKKHQVHYEVRTYHRFFIFHKLTSSTADTFLEYIERNLPEGVGLKVTRVEAKPVPDYLQSHQKQEQQLHK